ncbi:DUF5335 domain-containing protein [Thiohalomonas denitrificans]|uniref:DUF5335 domain-containing protein n=1 Tax=Thiohalomonas denitrificans TaxID=415747 RepID=UPI0026EA72A9|nr:DUF5335 domain-containing protein [Thiohalomonas denitrificans]
MTTTQLENSQWQTYFDQLARISRKQQVYIEAIGLGIGSQTESEWLPLIGITFDPKNDLLEVATERVDHLVRHPTRIQVQYEADGLHNVEVIDAEGNQQIIRLREPLKLPEG